MIYLQSWHCWSTFSISAAKSTICGFDISNKSSWPKAAFIMSYFFKIKINYIVIRLITWCGRLKIRQIGVKLMAPYFEKSIYKYNKFWTIAGSQLWFLIWYITLLNLTFNVSVSDLTNTRRLTSLERSDLRFLLINIAMFVVKLALI